MTHYQCYPKVPLQDLPRQLREQAMSVTATVIREREKDQPYSLPQGNHRPQK